MSDLSEAVGISRCAFKAAAPHDMPAFDSQHANSKGFDNAQLGQEQVSPQVLSVQEGVVAEGI